MALIWLKLGIISKSIFSMGGLSSFVLSSSLIPQGYRISFSSCLLIDLEALCKKGLMRWCTSLRFISECPFGDLGQRCCQWIACAVVNSAVYCLNYFGCVVVRWLHIENVHYHDRAGKERDILHNASLGAPECFFSSWAQLQSWIFLKQVHYLLFVHERCQWQLWWDASKRPLKSKLYADMYSDSYIHGLDPKQQTLT